MAKTEQFKSALIDAALAIRTLPFVGTRFVCPCCGWRLRTFTRGGTSLRSRPNGYCPRCNAKARHRRDWLYLEEETNLFTDRLRLLHVSPKYALSRRFVRMANLDYLALDIQPRPNITFRADVTKLPLRSDSVDAIICIHVLEHVDDDRAAMQELFRVLRRGGWALFTVPVRMDQKTYEDRSITTPQERKLAFGETSHVRYYGSDFSDRLAAVGFEVTIDLAAELSADTKAKYGLKDDENVFRAVKSHLP